jgi:hypothetical protein
MMAETTHATVPEPGRPVSLGSEVDRADAADLLSILRTVRVHQDRSGGNAYKVAREALWFMWEQRRLPRPLIRGKYPAAYPWSPGARALLDEHKAAGRPLSSFSGVVIEHLVPATLMVQEALSLATELDVDGMVELLAQHGAAAIVSNDDDRALTSAGVRSTMPDGWDGDPWARPQAAGLDPTAFAPLPVPERTEPVAKPARWRTGSLDGRSRDGRRDHTWESYVDQVGHDPAKIVLARSLAEQVDGISGWSSARTANQIRFSDCDGPVLAIQLWLVDGLRIEAMALDAPPPEDLFPHSPARTTVKGVWYWTLRDRPVDDQSVRQLIDIVVANRRRGIASESG